MAISMAAAMLGSAALSAGSSMMASRKAGRTQASADRYAADLVQQRYETTRADLEPWRDVGENALAELADLYGVGTGYSEPGTASVSDTREGRQEAAMDRFFTSPGYEFTLAEGEKQITRAAAAAGKTGSGQYGQALIDYASGVASQEFAGYANRLSGLAGSGQNAALGVGQIGANLARAGAGFQAEAGEAEASGIVGASNAFQGAIEDAVYLYGSSYGGGKTGGEWLNPDTNQMWRY